MVEKAGCTGRWCGRKKQSRSVQYIPKKANDRSGVEGGGVGLGDKKQPQVPPSWLVTYLVAKMHW